MDTRNFFKWGGKKLQDIISDNQDTITQHYLEAICNKNNGFVILNARAGFEKGEQEYFIENVNYTFLKMIGLKDISLYGKNVKYFEKFFLEADCKNIKKHIESYENKKEIIEVTCTNTNKKINVLVIKFNTNKISLILFEIHEHTQVSAMHYNKDVMETVYALEAMLKKRDLYTYRHQIVVGLLSVKIAEKLNLSEERKEGIYICGLLHDIGKIAIPMELLTKPDKLTGIEYEILKSHVMHSYEILRNIEFPWPVAEIVLQHHEKLDGSGYPKGLTENEIYLEAQILSVADVLEAMVANRPYRASLGLKYSLGELKKYAGKYYSKAVVNACIDLCKDKDWNVISKKAGFIHDELLIEP